MKNIFLKIITTFIICYAIPCSSQGSTLTKKIELIPDSLELTQGRILSIRAIYSVYDENDQLIEDDLSTGIGLRIHFDSSKFDLIEIKNEDFFEYGFLGDGELNLPKVEEDNDELDKNDDDENTDKRILFQWVVLGNYWPFQTLPLEIFKIRFKIKTKLEPGETNINLTCSSTGGGYLFSGEDLKFSILPFKPIGDFNNDEKVDNIDTLILIKHLAD